MSKQEEMTLAKAGIVTLASNLEGIKKAVEEFNMVKKQLLTSEHYLTFKDKHGQEHKYIKKSGWRIVALGFNISDRIVGKEIKDLGDGEFSITYTVEAIAPNGRISQDTGTCSTLEKTWIDKEHTKPNPRKIHDTDSHALTRAKNRAISGLVGLGEVSAEEVDTNGDHIDQTITSNFCQVEAHKPSHDTTSNKCKICSKMVRMP